MHKQEVQPSSPTRCMIVWLPSLQEQSQVGEGIQGMQFVYSLCHAVQFILCKLHALVPCSKIYLVAILMAAEQRLHHVLHILFRVSIACAPYCLSPLPVEAQWV